MPRPLRRLPGFASRPTVSRLTSVRAVRRPPSRCAASTGSWCGRRACVSAPSRTPCSTPSTPTRVDAPAGGFYVSAVPLSLHNTLTRRLEPFQPLAPPRVTLYTCGPTVWNYAHIGNFRTFLFEDLLRRYLELSGYDVFHVMNLTDVDDRTIKAAAAAGKRLEEHTAPFVAAFFADCDYLRIRKAHVYPRATQSVPAMVRLVQRLLDAGVAYRGEDGSVYFAIAKFPSYGRLSQLDRREIKIGARVASDEYAKDDLREQSVDAAAVRLLFSQTHYRRALDFSDEALAAAGQGVKRLGEFRDRLVRAGGPATPDGRLAALAARFESDFRAALDDDLNAPRACAALFELVHDGNGALDAGAAGAAVARDALDRAMAVLDVLPTPRAVEPGFAGWVDERIAARDKARGAKDFREADRIRAELKAKGVEIEDTPSGTKWRMV